MMRRQEWRDLVAQILSDGLPLVYGRVFKARVWPLQLPELPAVLVYGWQETKSRKTLDVWTHQFEVTCSIAIEGRIQAPETAMTLKSLSNPWRGTSKPRF
jgi:hypothetical protein